MSHTKVYCGLDIGNSNIKALILRRDKARDYEEVLGFARLPTKGFSKGSISEVGLFCDTVESVLKKAQKISRAIIDSLFVNISGTHIKSYEGRAGIQISDFPMEVTQEQIQRAIELAKTLNMPIDREVISLLPLIFLIDEKFELQDPLGLYATKLDVVLNIITGQKVILNNITKSINMIGYEVKGIVLAGLALGESILTQAEQKDGTIIIDIGSQMTSLTIYLNGRLKNFFVLPFGGDDLTQAIADEFGINFNLAEEVKTRYGLVLENSSPGPSHTQLEFSMMGGSWVELKGLESDRARQEGIQTKKITRQDLSFILLPKTKALFEQIKKTCAFDQLDKKVLPKIFITGGGSLLDGLIETAQEILEMPVELRGLNANLVTSSNMQGLDFIFYVTSLGLARFGARSELFSRGAISAPRGIFAKVFSRVRNIYEDYF